MMFSKGDTTESKKHHVFCQMSTTLCQKSSVECRERPVNSAAHIAWHAYVHAYTRVRIPKHSVCQIRSIFYQMSPKFCHKSPTFCHMSPVLWNVQCKSCVPVNSPPHHAWHACIQKSQKNPYFCQMRSVFCQVRPKFGLMSPRFCPKSPVFCQTSPIF